MRSKRFWFAFLCIALVGLAGDRRLSAAVAESQEVRELKDKMAAEGWTQIADGVFERHRGATKVEHLGYGREGLAWTIGDLQRQQATLRQMYDRDRSEDIAKVIDNLSVMIAKAKRELKNLPKGLTNTTAAVTGAGCSDICYGATADAYPLTAAQGVGAVADAKFNSTCGYSGDTYAYAFAVATLNGTTTTIIQEDPRTGTNITSHAAASVNGKSIAGTPCSSSANAWAQSTALGISYSTSDTNGSCPVPPNPPSCSAISGPSFLDFTTKTCGTSSWSVSCTNCTSPTYQWKYSGTVVGTNSSSYSRSVCWNQSPNPFTIAVTVTCSNGGPFAPSQSVDVFYEPGCGLNPCP